MKPALKRLPLCDTVSAVQKSQLKFTGADLRQLS